MAGLQQQGYAIIEHGYPFLGRLRVVAESDEIHREIVVNPGTGEILRDYAICLTDIQHPVPDLDGADSDGTVPSITVSRSPGTKPRDAGNGNAGDATPAAVTGMPTIGTVGDPNEGECDRSSSCP